MTNFKTTIAGHEIRTRSNRRFIVVAVRETDAYVVRRGYDSPVNRNEIVAHPYVVRDGSLVPMTIDEALEIRDAARETDPTVEIETYVAFARVERRSDDVETARKHAKRFGNSFGSFAVVVDTATGDVV